MSSFSSWLQPSPLFPLISFLPLAALAAWLLSSGRAADARDLRIVALLASGVVLAILTLVALNLVYEPTD
jgi:hypothetical protein